MKDDIFKNIEKLFLEDNRDRKNAPFITVQELQNIKDTEELILVDVRTEEERAVSMIPGAISRDDFERQAESFRAVKIISYCTVGGRSGEYTELLRAKGLNAYNLKGSVLAWAFIGETFIDQTGQKTNRVHVSGTKWDLLPDTYKAIW